MGVDPYKGNIYDIPFGHAGMVAHENRWLAQRGEFLIAENVTFENDALQKDTSVTAYDAQGVDVFAYYAQGLSVSGNWEGAWAIYRHGPTITINTPTSISFFSASGPTLSITTTAAIASGATVLCAVRLSNGFTPTITDSKGNTYTLQIGGSFPNVTGDPTVNVCQFTSTLTTALTASDTFTLTFTGTNIGVWFQANVFPLQVPPAPPTPLENGTATASAVTTFQVPSQNFATTARIASPGPTTYPLFLVAAIFVDHDVLTGAITAQNGFTGPVTTDLSTVGQMIVMWKEILAAPAIVAQVDYNSQFNSGNIAGTVTVTQGNQNITGSGTSFLTAFRTNDEITVNGETHAVQFVSTNTALVTYDVWAQSTASAQTASRRAGPTLITAAMNNVSATGGTIYKETPGVLPFLRGTDLVTIARVRRGRFVLGGKESSGQSRKLFYFNGSDPVRFLADDGTTMTVIGTPPADWDTVINANKQPVNGIVHQGALFAFGNLSDPHRIYRSTSADHTKFQNTAAGDDAGQYPIGSSIGERLWCGAEYQGVLFLWKYPRGIFYFDDTDPNFLNWSYHVRSEALGCAPSPHAVLPIDDDVLFCAPDGHFHLLMAVANLGGTRTSDLTRLLGLHRWTREHIDVPSLGQMCSVYNSYTKTAYFGVRSRAATQPDNDLLLAFDFSKVSAGGMVRFSYKTAYRPNALCIRRSASTGSPQAGTPLVMIGELNTSMLQQLDDGSTGTRLTHGSRLDPIRGGLYTATSYAITATMPRLDFVDVDPMNRQRRKNFDWVEFVFGESAISDLSGQTLTAQFFVDGLLMQTMTLGNVTNTRIAKPLRIGDGYDVQIVLTTQAIVSAAAASPVLLPDIVGIGALVFWRPGGMDHSRPT